MNKTDRIYVAGHRGLVGSALVKKLQDLGYSNLLLRKRDELNLEDQASVRQFFLEQKPTHVILAAARVGGIKANMTHPSEFLYQNLQIQNNVIWAAHEYDVQKLLFLGSSCIYPRDCPQPMKEEYFLTGKPEPTNEAYAIAKISGMKLCEYLYSQYGKEFISCMPTNIYGPGDNFDIESSHVIPALMRRMHEAKQNNDPEIVIWGSGISRREFLHVDDLADALIFLMKNYSNKEFVNIGTGLDISIKELAIILKEVVGYEGSLVFDTSKPDGMPKKLLDVSKINEAGWKASVPLKEGLGTTYEWFRNSL